ncbi:MAG: alpha/beta hydrolase [Ginsengibacter sp.]
MRSIYILLLSLFLSPVISTAQKVIPLYSTVIPNARAYPDKEHSNSTNDVVFRVSKPELFVFLPDPSISTGTAVIICPGGGYGGLVIDREGYDIARRFVKEGVAGFVLKYRLPSDSTMIDKSIGPLQDAQQAIKIIRQRAKEWNINTNQIGIMGFSAGGHLASTAGTHFDRSYITNENDINLRPDFMILVYPVISMKDNITHKGTRNNLLGKDPSISQVNNFSNETRVNSQTPPAFISAASDDSAVSVANSIDFYDALLKNKISASMHIYAKGGHGFLKLPPRDLWMNELKYWMKNNGWVK